MRLELSATERDHLIRLLEQDLSEQRVEVRRTSTPAYHDKLVSEERALRELLDKLRKLREEAQFREVSREITLARTTPTLDATISDADPITRGADRILQQAIPGAAGQPHTTIVGGGHFLQEDRGEELARVVVDFISTAPAR